jgi:hypothetical protein
MEGHAPLCPTIWALTEQRLPSGRRKRDRRKTEAEKSADQSDRFGEGLTKESGTNWRHEKENERSRETRTGREEGGVICSHRPVGGQFKKSNVRFRLLKSRGYNI